MLKIRLQRIGRKRMPVFRIVVAEHTSPVAGRFVEKLGSFVGGNKDATLNFKEDRVLHWVSMGAQPSQTVARLFAEKGVKGMEKFIEKRAQKTSKAELEAAAKKEEEAAAKKEAAEAAKAEAEAAKAAEESAKAAESEASEEKTEEAA